MLFFVNDYAEGATPEILERLKDTNYTKEYGYGEDQYTIHAQELIRKACKAPDAEIRLLSGGTQTNQIIIDSLLTKYEGVIAATTGHVNLHEAGAIEFTGHKVMTIPGKDGKITAGTLKQYLLDFYADGNHEHMAFPGMVYISHPTEYGTLYSREELEAISRICKEYAIPLFLDGARLGYGLVCRETDLTLPDIAKLTDVFYIGGTKVGALIGEAVVFTHANMPKHFVTTVKQHGALLAKGRILGIQFETLFTDDLYYRIARNAIEGADRIREALTRKGYTFFLQSPTNQIFIVLEDEERKRIEEKAALGFWEKYDDHHTVMRIATSWATRPEDVDALIDIL